VRPKLLVYNLTFPPDQVSTAYLVADIVKGVSEEGWDVQVFTSTPHYNFSKDFTKISSKSGFFNRKTDYYGVPVTHCYQYKARNILIRGVFILYFHLSFFRYVIFNEKPDVIYAPSPPLTSGFISGILAKLYGIKVVYNVQEIYPDILRKSNYKLPSFIWNALGWIERKTYEWSDKIVTIDEYFARRLVLRTDSGKVCVIPNFVSISKEEESIIPSGLKGELENKYVLAYFGNLGRVQNWELIIDVMGMLKADKEIVLLLVGGGDRFEFLCNAALENDNIILLPYQSKSSINGLMELSDLHIIAMDSASDYDGLPSKSLSILAHGKPLLVSTSSDTPLANLTENCGNAVRVDLNDVVSFADAVNKFKADEFTHLSSRNGIAFVQMNYTKEKVLDSYLKLFNDLLES